MNVSASLHHAHLFASNLDESISFYRDMLGAEVVFDTSLAGARNVLLKLGDAYLNFYDQPPKDTGRGAVHHLGIRTNDLAALVAHMKSRGFEFRKRATEFEAGKYVMAMAPDGVLLELFETDAFDVLALWFATLLVQGGVALCLSVKHVNSSA